MIFIYVMKKNTIERYIDSIVDVEFTLKIPIFGTLNFKRLKNKIKKLWQKRLKN